MGAVLLVVLVLVVVAGGVVGARLVRSGRREAELEKARLAEELRVQALRSMDEIWKMDSRAFEEFVAGLCRRDGCVGVRRVGGAGDLGADVTGALPDGRRLVVQCKRYARERSVGSRDIQTFNGTARVEHGAEVPVFVASCRFTRQARAFAAKHELTLIDVDLLGLWNKGTPLMSLLDLDISRSGSHRRLTPDR